MVPPSSETSTPPTRPPPVSVAVPLIVVASPLSTFAPAPGELIWELGGAVSVEASFELTAVLSAGPVQVRGMEVAEPGPPSPLRKNS